MAIDFHSEKFKRTMIWVMALVILPSFLIGGGIMSGLFYSLFGGGPRDTEGKVTVFGEEKNYRDYSDFEYRWRRMARYCEVLYPFRDDFRGTKSSYSLAQRLIPRSVQNQQLFQYYLGIIMESFPKMPVRIFDRIDRGDMKIPGGMFAKVFNWMPEATRERYFRRGATEKVREKILAEFVKSLYARYVRAGEMDLIPSDEVVQAKKDEWFTRVPEGATKPAFDKKMYLDFVTQVIEGIDSRIADSAFHETLRELIAIDNLEQAENPDWYLYKIDLEAAADRFIKENQQRKVDFFKVDKDAFMIEARQYIEKNPPCPVEPMKDKFADAKEYDAALEKYKAEHKKYTDSLKAYYRGNEKKFQQPRFLKGDYLLINMDKVDAAAEKKAKAELKPPTEKEIAEYYKWHKLEFTKPDDAMPPAKPGEDEETKPGDDAMPPSTPCDAMPADPQPEENDPQPPDPVKEEEAEKIDEKIKAKIVKILEERKLKTAIEKARMERLAEIHKGVSDYLAEAQATQTPAAMADVNCGNVLQKLIELGKTAAAEVEKVTLLPDLKPAAERYEEVSLHSVKDFIDGEKALEFKDIGGTDFADLFEAIRYKKIEDIDFNTLGSAESKTRFVSRCLLSGLLDSKSGKHKFIFRITDVQEPRLIEFEDIDARKPELKKELVEAFNKNEVLKRARLSILNQKKRFEKEIKSGKFKFDKSAQANLTALEAFGKTEKTEKPEEAKKPAEDPAKPATDGADKDKEKEDKAKAFSTTPYFTRYNDAKFTISGVTNDIQVSFINDCFNLPEDGSSYAIVSVPLLDYFYAVRLTTDTADGAAVRKPTFEDFREGKRRTYGNTSETMKARFRKRYEYFSNAVKIERPKRTAPPPSGG